MCNSKLQFQRVKFSVKYEHCRDKAPITLKFNISHTMKGTVTTMKKIIAMLMALVIIAAMASVAVSATTEVSPAMAFFDFTDQECCQIANSQDESDTLWWGKSKRFDSLFHKDEYTTLYFRSEDATQEALHNPYMTAVLPENLQFSPEYAYCKICYRTESPATMFNIYFAVDDMDMWDAGYNVNGYIENDGEWHEMIMDMTENALWEDAEKVTVLRLDYMSGGDIMFGDSIDLKYAAFFMSEEEAEQYEFPGNKGVEIIKDWDWGQDDDKDDDTTAEDTTAVDSESAEVTTAEVTTAAEVTTVADTTAAAKAEETTTAEKNSGCGGVIGGFTVIAVISLAGICVKRK